MSDTRAPIERPDRDEVAFAAMASAVVRQATTFIGICDSQLRPYFVNAAGRGLVGLPQDADVRCYKIGDFFTPEHRPIIESVGIPAVLNNGQWTGELCFRHFTDPRMETEVRWSAFALRDEAGHLIGLATFTTDISARKQAERALRDQERLLSSLLENLPLGVGVYDHDGALVHSNERMRDYGGLTRLPSSEPASSQRWRGYDDENRPIPPDRYPGACALRGESVVPGIDFLYDAPGGTERWMRVSAVPFRQEAGDNNAAIVVIQDVDDLKRASERIASAGAALASQTRFLDTTLRSIPDFVYAFDRNRRFAYANPAMLSLFGRSADEMLGRTFLELDYPSDLAARLNAHLDHVLKDGAIVEDEVFFRSATGHAAYFSFLWGPVYAEDGSVELVVGVSRETTERRKFEEELQNSEARLRAATELVGLGIYSWDPITGALEWDERVRAMWGLPPEAAVDMGVYEAGIHPDDLPRVRDAIAACVDPAGDGQYHIEYKVRGRDGMTRHIATSGRATFEEGRAVGFIGAAIDVTAQRRAEAAIRASEAQFRSFAEHSSNLIWISEPEAGTITYRSAAYDRIWGIPVQEGPVRLSEWMKDVHPDDRQQIGHALASVRAGEVVQFEYRIVRPGDGVMRWLRDTSFPIPDDNGAVTRIGGITEDTTQADIRQVYVVSATASEARRLANIVRGIGYHVRAFVGASAFLDMAPVLAPGCVIVDLRKAVDAGLSVPRELKARSVALPTIAVDAPGAEVMTGVSAMKAGAVDYVVMTDEASLRLGLAAAMAECQGAIRPTSAQENASARVARLTPRERDVLVGLVGGGTNKTIALELGISPRTVELYRSQVMNRLDASNLPELVQTAIAAGIRPRSEATPFSAKARRKPT